ncbi:MAG: tubulin-like doman-containing protein [Desulfuromonadaceae bacterium]
MNQNHLIIGLGGTGGKIIRSFRKTLYQEFRVKKPDTANIDYLYVDSDKELMKYDEPSWKTLGKSVQLGKNQQLLIQDANLNARLESINNFPGIKSWIGRKDQWEDILKSIVGEVLGGQKRRLGRFLFACKIDEFREKIQNRTKALQENGLTSVTFHVCCGLAGGTGSGSVVDVVSQIRAMYPDSKNFRIIIYALLPDTTPDSKWKQANYHANGYAALVELNSLSVGSWEPHDLSGVKDRLSLPDPFNGCYLFYNDNENGLSVNVDRDIPNIVADFLYQKLIAVNDVSWPGLSRMENAENGDGTPECLPGSRKGQRSKRFLSFGIKRLAIPEEEIREFMTYNFARQATLQMIYNNWSDSVGFLDEAKILSFSEKVSNPELQEKYLITDAHLILSRGILRDEINNKKWKPIDQHYEDLLPNLKELARQQDPKTWLDELSRLCEKHYDRVYRGLGVREFYEVKGSACNDQAREIRNRIEADLFDQWRDGQISIHEIGLLLDALIADLYKRNNKIDGELAKAKEDAESVAAKMNANRKEWVKMGIITAKLFGKRDRLMDAHSIFMLEYNIQKTKIEGWQFAKKLLPKLISEITGLKTEIANCISLISEETEKFKNQINERCADDVKNDLRSPLVKFYNPAQVKEFTKELTTDADVQRAQASEVRMAIIKQLGDNPNFTAFNTRMDKLRFVDILESTCEEGAVTAHNNLIATKKEKTRQLGVSIIEKLYKEYGGDLDRLQKYINSLVALAGNYLIFDPTEVNKVGSGVSAAASKVSDFTVILPRAPELAPFVTTLQDTFKKSLSSNMEIIQSDAKPNEIALISITNLFPLRFVKQVKFLEDCYKTRISGSDSERAKLELHCESEVQHPRLFLHSQTEVRSEGLPFLLLAKILGLIKDEQNLTTGKSELLLLRKNDIGLDIAPLRFGQNLMEAEDKIDEENIEVIRSEVQKVLEQEYRHMEKQNELKKQIVSEVEIIKALRHGDFDDPVYGRFLKAAHQAVKIVGGEG